MEDALPILYVYEVQVVPAMQRKGLGAFVMTLLKLLAKKSQLEAIMLTVLNVSNSFLHTSGWLLKSHRSLLFCSTICKVSSLAYHWLSK